MVTDKTLQPVNPDIGIFWQAHWAAQVCLLQLLQVDLLVKFISKRLEKIKAPWSSQSPGDALPLSQTIATSQTWKQFWKESTQVVVNDASKNSRPTLTIAN